MANFQQPIPASTVEGWPSWHQQQLCLPSDDRVRRGFAAPRGRLSDNPHAEAVLQGVLLFGPSVFVLVGTLVRVCQLYRAKLVTVPNYRGIPKAVSRQENIGSSVYGLIRV